MLTEIGQYEIYRELGSGGFGTVYLARDQITGVIVAVKVLNPEISASPEFQQRFYREAEALRSLPGHPNIVRLLNYGDFHGTPYLVMDYLPGKDLRDLMGDANLYVRQALSIGIQVARALEAANLGGLVHCDIKPENLRILPDRSVKVMDFGIARAVDTNFREIAGTPAYIAPELWRGELPGAATDMYALGCVLYEMIVGRTPFRSTSDDPRQERRDLAESHCNLEPDWSPIQSLQQDTRLVGLLKALLAKPAAARPQARLVREEMESLEKIIQAEVRLAPGYVPSSQVWMPIEDAKPEETILREDNDHTILHTPLEVPARPGSDSAVTTTPPQRLERLATGEQIFVQRHLATIDLGADACRAALVHNGKLISGTLTGDLVTLDLQTGRLGRWNVFPKGGVVSSVWGMAAYADRVVVHAGGPDWVECNLASGQILRSGTFPEGGLNLLVAGEWLYMSGGRRVYRQPLVELGRRAEEFPTTGRVAGMPVVERGSIYLPTSTGLQRLPPGATGLQTFGSTELSRVVFRMNGRQLGVVYPQLQANSSQSACLRRFQLSPEFRLLHEIIFPGQLVGIPQAVENWLVLAFQDGRLVGCEMDDEGIQPRWETRIGGGRTLQAGAAYGNGLIAAVSGSTNGSVLSIIHMVKGEILLEQPLQGDYLLPPFWWERTLSLVNAAGGLEVFRVSV